MNDNNNNLARKGTGEDIEEGKVVQDSRIFLYQTMNNNNNNLVRKGTEKDIEEGKAVQDNRISMTTTTTTYQQARRRFPEHTTVGTLTSSSTSYTWNNNNGNSNNNNTINTMTTYNNNKSLPISSSWVNDPEIKRQRRIVKYKSYAVEGKMKASIRSGFRWVKNKYCQLVHGY
ncbi:hypothetical protein Dsin_028488 [Dipteronia sinensis]|uniref:Uncharacterized protein n=1 Tax=Dipteronia sinensis TaxID=43782 RepID=A0AAD9ZQY2_9ROSI|nr:hypothetical protein Dsin_028488 [Dipteronia sinensis]